MAAWQGRVLRRQQLEELLQQGLIMSERLAAKAAFRGWQNVRASGKLSGATGGRQGMRSSSKNVVDSRDGSSLSHVCM